MRIATILVTGLIAATPFAIVTAAPPPPTTTAATPFMKMAGESDVFEISSSQIALQKSQNADLRAFASMLIEHHTETTNMLLKQAKAAGLTPPPAVLSPPKMAMIAQLQAASPASFDRVYLSQQVTAHEQALALHSTYAKNGDVAQLRTAAAGAVPIVTRHLDTARRMSARAK